MTGYFRGAHDAAHRYVRVALEYEEFSLAHVGQHVRTCLSPSARQQGEQIFAATDAITKRVRKIGGTTLRSIGQIGRLQRVLDNDADYVTPLDMLAELRDEAGRATCDEAQRRTWFLFEASRPGEPAGHADGA